MKLDIKQTHYHTHEQKLQELFKQHLSELVDCTITSLSVELTAQPAAYRLELPMFHLPERRIFTYEGYTKSDKWFKLIYCE